MRKKKKEKKKEEKENKQNKKRMDMVNTEKRKEKQEVQLLNYQQIALPCLRNKTKARQKINENNREKSKSRKVNRNSGGLAVHILDQRTPGLGENSGESGSRRSHGTGRSTSQLVPNMLFSI